MQIHRYGFTRVSSNRKTGRIPVTKTSRNSCPATCPHLRKCYGEDHWTGQHWNKVDSEGADFAAYLDFIRQIPDGQVWRDNEVGDRAQNARGEIDATAAKRVAKAAEGTQGITYTHHDPKNAHNSKVIAEMNRVTGLTVNLSADGLEQADEYADLGIGPVVTTLPSDCTENLTTPAGRTVVICPHTTHGIQCADCKLCHRKDRAIVGFPAHGSTRGHIDRVHQNLVTLAED